MRRQILKVIDEIRPYVQSDGGDIEFVDFVNNVVQIRMVGACRGCPSSTVTLHQGIERRIREEFPQIIRVEALPN